MLVLERKEGQKIVLKTSDGPVEIVVYNIQQGRVSVGVNAPQSVPIIREELLSKV